MEPWLRGNWVALQEDLSVQGEVRKVVLPVLYFAYLPCSALCCGAHAGSHLMISFFHVFPTAFTVPAPRYVGSEVKNLALHEAWLLLSFFKRGALWNETERLKHKGNFLTENQILQLLLGICRGLEAIHAKGHAHRDLKPTNILLGDEGQPVLMDLGSMNQACIRVEGSRQALTLQDWAAQWCTISYRALELFSVQSHCVIDERTDVWSLGCVLYAMMFGEGPYDMVFQKGDSVALAVQNQLSIPQSPRHSSALQPLLASMMTVDPQQCPHIPLLLSQLEALQPPASGQHTTQI
uniref:non-specific serine/threonine protein kinase n=1 Tax=Sciurus vulgaris TaxID=55149 RepID=A0A8D2B7P2_SCIVU